MQVVDVPFARNGSAAVDGTRPLRCSRGAAKFYDRQVFAAAIKTDIQSQFRAGTSAHQRPRLRARRTSAFRR